MHLAISLTLVWKQQEDEHAMMHCQRWLRAYELRTAFFGLSQAFLQKETGGTGRAGLCPWD